MHDFKNVLIICNPKTKDSELIERALRLLAHNKGVLTVIDVLKTLPQDALTHFEDSKIESLQQAVIDERKKQLDAFLGSFHHKKVSIQAKVLTGNLFIEVIKEVHHNRHDLVMLTADGAGPIKDQVFGSNSMHLIRKCPCPVWVIKPAKLKRYREIVAAVDPSSDGEKGDLNDKILETAVLIARMDKAKLHVVHACDFYAETLLKESPFIHHQEVEHMAHHIWEDHKHQYDSLLSKFKFDGVPLEQHYRKGDAADIITQIANKEDVDLVVMGTVNRMNYKGVLIGSTAERVCYQVNNSILALKPEGFISPVPADC